MSDIYDPNKFFVIALANRPGVQLFCTKLEYTYYPPRTSKNDDFGLNIVTWQELIFYVISVPLKDYGFCESVAKDIGMNIVDGIPTTIDHSGTKHFPLQGDNVWSLEGQYKGDEIAEVKKIFDGDKGKMLTDFQVKTEIRHGTPADLDCFMEDAVAYNSFSPIMAILFGGDRRRCVDECFLGYIQDKAFSCCTISHNGEQESGQPAIVGLYVIPKARKLGIGSRLFRKTILHCINNALVPVYVDVMSEAVMRIIKKLPIEMSHNLIINNTISYDLAKLEEPYVSNIDWYAEA